jgi:hypothetical protein
MNALHSAPPAADNPTPLPISREQLENPGTVIDLLHSYESLTFEALDLLRLYSGFRLPQTSPLAAGVRPVFEEHGTAILQAARSLVTRMRSLGGLCRLHWQLEQMTQDEPLRSRTLKAIQSLGGIQWSWRPAFQRVMGPPESIPAERLQDHVFQLAHRHEEHARLLRTAGQLARDLGASPDDLSLIQRLAAANDRQLGRLQIQFGLHNLF